jgi:acetyl esterase/lipase
VDIAVPIVKDETSDARYNSAGEEQTQVTPSATAIMGVEDLTPLSLAPAGTRIQYGDDPLQFGELSLPAGRVGSDHPVVINVHGGCWLSEYPIDHSRALARALAGSGFAVWNIEYRRVGDSGGGWPGTFEDVAAAADFIRKLAEPYRLDLARVVLMGHSAGGQLALWLACRKRIPRRSVLAARDPLPVRGVVALAPATELVELYEQQVYDGVIGKLLGGSPREVPERFDAVVPSGLRPPGSRSTSSQADTIANGAGTARRTFVRSKIWKPHLSAWWRSRMRGITNSSLRRATHGSRSRSPSPEC